MKQILFTLVLLCSFALTACGDNSNKDIVMVDSAKWQQLVSRIDSLDTENKRLQSCLSEIKESESVTIIDQFSTIFIILVILGVLGLIGASYCLYFLTQVDHDIEDCKDNIKNLERSTNNLKEETRNSSIDRKKTNVSSEATAYKPSKEMVEILELKQKIEILQKNIATIVKGSSQNNVTTIENSSKKEEEIHYLSNPVSDGENVYFLEVLSSRSDKAYFRLIVLNDKEAYYELLDLQKVKSANWLENVVRTKGCPMDEANNFTTTYKGKLVKFEDQWKVQKPTEIKLKK